MGAGTRKRRLGRENVLRNKILMMANTGVGGGVFLFCWRFYDKTIDLLLCLCYNGGEFG